MSTTSNSVYQRSNLNNDRAIQIFGLTIFGLLLVFLGSINMDTTMNGIESLAVKEKPLVKRTKVPSFQLPNTEPDELPSAPSHPMRPTYAPRGRYSLVSDTDEDMTATRDAMIQDWGSWTLMDDKERPIHDFYGDYPHRDVPRSKFPTNAWQLDREYLSKFLPESLALVERAQRAIRAEYGQEDKAPSEMSFTLCKYPDSTNVTDKGSKQAGWTTEDSWQALVKRILHAIMTEDVFVFAMGGHSAAAGHGNHFQQSYTLQVQWILEAVFARMGVQHIARNFGNGGLGTIHNGMAAADIYGHDVDMIMWDSGMTERSARDIELLHRQALIGSRFKVPVLWTLAEKQALQFYRQANVPIGIPGSGYKGLPTVRTYEDVMAQPFAPRYLNCKDDVKEICNNNRYDSVCWVDRPDVTPQVAQDKAPGGRASWHPGNREHQIQGRVLAYTILEAIKDALKHWNEAEDYVLPDEAWHVSTHYEELRTAVKGMNLTQTNCLEFGTKYGMEFLCHHPIKSRTEFTPRAFPSLTNIRNLMHPDMRVNVNDASPNMYEPPDVFNPSLNPPVGEIDVLSIVELGVSFRPMLAPTYAEGVYKKPSFSEPPQVTVGKGTLLQTATGDDYCDGSVHSWCKRGYNEKCLLRAHNDGRNGLIFDGLSGWIVLTIPDLLHGQIIVKLETWHPAGENYRTSTFLTVNNETTSDPPSQRTLQHDALSKDEEHLMMPANSSRMLKKKPPELCEMFLFQYAINGEINTVNRTTFKERKHDLARVVETYVVLDDPNFTGGVETQVEVAVRMVGCERYNTFKLSHIYWT